MKAPVTARATKLLIAELEELRGEGHDPAALLDQSVMNDWRSLVPLKGDGRQPKSGRHVGFANVDYTKGLKKKQDGSYEVGG